MSKEWNMKNAEYDRIKKEVLTKYSKLLLEKLILEENYLQYYLAKMSKSHKSINNIEGRIHALRFALGQLDLGIGEDEIATFRKKHTVDGKFIVQT